MHKKWLIGVDEAGRGSLAGPVSVGAFCVPHDFDFSIFSVVRDSKQLSPKMRERIFGEVHKLVRTGAVRYSVALVPARIIDTEGIIKAVAQGIVKVLEELKRKPAETEVRLDGLLHAPKKYKNQKTIIKGDVTEPTISLASIMAKVVRDRHMVALAKKFPAYGFEIHKGYGTVVHRTALKKKGLSTQHRKSFCKKFTGAQSPKL